MIVRTAPRLRRFGLGQAGVTAAQLQNVKPGSQPSFITGSYPNATWSTLDSDNNGYAVYLPYSQSQILANAPANYGLSDLNQAVSQQYSALVMAANPQLQANVWVPSAATCKQYAGGSVPPACVPFVGPSAVPVAAPKVVPVSAPVPVVTAAPVASAPVASAAAPVSEPAYFASAPSASSGGFSLSSIPWWGWAAAAGLALVVVSGK